MRKDLTDIIDERKVQLPNHLFYRFAHFVLKIWFELLCRPKYIYHFDKKEMKGKQVIVLADHSSWSAFFYVLIGYPFVDLNVVIGYHQAFRKYLFTLFRWVGTILKRHFETDLRAVRQMLKVTKMGGSLLLFPEGTFSFAGSTCPVNPSTVDMLRKLGVPVVLCSSRGAYCSRPVYKRHTARKAVQEFHYEVLFTPEELQEKKADELYEKLMEHFRYNDFEWNREKKIAYHDRTPNVFGADKILYRCPNCGAEFTLDTEGDTIVCSVCRNTIRMDEFFALHPADELSVCPYRDISEWYIDQRRRVREEIKAPEYSVIYDCTMLALHTDRMRFKPFYPCGEGTARIDENGVHYRGMRNGKWVDMTFDIKNLPGFRCEFKLGNVFYYHNEFFALVPKKDVRMAAKYMIVVEELHDRRSPKWARARRDAYGYECLPAAETDPV